MILIFNLHQRFVMKCSHCSVLSRHKWVVIAPANCNTFLDKKKNVKCTTSKGKSLCWNEQKRLCFESHTNSTTGTTGSFFKEILGFFLISGDKSYSAEGPIFHNYLFVNLFTLLFTYFWFNSNQNHRLRICVMTYKSK